MQEHQMPTRQPNSLAAQQKPLDSLLRAADERREQGLYAQAEPIYRRALELAESAFGAEHPEVAVVLNNLAVLYKYTGNFDEAEALYRRALAITEQVMGTDHLSLATLYHNLGGLEHARGRYAMGETHARR